MFDYTVPDTMAFFNPCFLPRILESVSNQMNKIVTKLAVEEPRFRGKVSIIGHSLGTVISYDLLTRQKWQNFNAGPANDNAFDAIQRIRNGQARRTTVRNNT